MIEPFTTVSALALFTMVSPGLGVAVSLINCAFGMLSWFHVWPPATHHVQAVAHAAQLI